MNCDGSDLCLQGIRELGGHKAQNLGGTAGVASSSSYRQMQLTNAKAAMHTHGIRNNPPWVPLSVSFQLLRPCPAQQEASLLALSSHALHECLPHCQFAGVLEASKEESGAQTSI